MLYDGSIEIWATLGPSSLNREVIQAISGEVSMFRLNLSHLHDVIDPVKFIRKHSNVPICLDTDCGKYGEFGLLNEDFDSYKITDADIVKLSDGFRYGVKTIALSFAQNKKQVEDLKDKFECDSVIAKIESPNGIHNLTDINEIADALLIDRGDLSRSIDIEKIPAIQEEIIKKCSKVYVATNMMDTLSNTGVPSTGEVNDVWCTLQQGAAGIVLAGETAIGKHPIECVQMVRRIINEFQRVQNQS